MKTTSLTLILILILTLNGCYTQLLIDEAESPTLQVEVVRSVSSSRTHLDSPTLSSDITNMATSDSGSCAESHHYRSSEQPGAPAKQSAQGFWRAENRV